LFGRIDAEKAGRNNTARNDQGTQKKSSGKIAWQAPDHATSLTTPCAAEMRLRVVSAASSQKRLKLGPPGFEHAFWPPSHLTRSPMLGYFHRLYSSFSYGAIQHYRDAACPNGSVSGRRNEI
jgi:hypothetical protein